MRKRTYVKKDVWHLRKGKKEKGGFFPLAGPLIASVEGQIIEPLLGKVIKKIVVGGKKHRRRRKRKRIY